MPGKQTYLFVFILQRDLVLARTLPLGPLYFLPTADGRTILQAEHSTAAVKIRTEMYPLSPLTFRTPPLSQFMSAGRSSAMHSVKRFIRQQQVERDGCGGSGREWLSLCVHYYLAKFWLQLAGVKLWKCGWERNPLQSRTSLFHVFCFYRTESTLSLSPNIQMIKVILIIQLTLLAHSEF